MERNSGWSQNGWRYNFIYCNLKNFKRSILTNLIDLIKESEPNDVKEQCKKILQLWKVILMLVKKNFNL